MKREAVLGEILKRRRLGVMLVLTGLAFILLFAAYLALSMQLNGPASSCRTSPLIEEKSRVDIMSCMADGAQAQERGLLMVPVAIAGGALTAAGAGVLMYPFTMTSPQRAKDATWEAFAPRAELDLGPALTR
jgi:Na+-transporting methylmalonyl-CoA/oxaloacetate decarboxylase gamma subunit